MSLQLPEPSYAEVNGDAIAWYSIGDGPETMVGSPGMFASVESIVESPGAVQLISRLAEIRRVVLFDYRTTGLSDTFSDDREPAVGDWVDDIAAIIDATGRRSVDLFGIGTAAPSVIAAASAMPDRVRTLMLISGCPKLIRGADYPEGMDPEVFKAWNDAVGGAVGAAAVERELLGLMSELDRTFMRRSGYQGARPRAARRLLAALANTDVRGELSKVSCPTLIIHGDQDPFIPAACARSMADAIASSTLELLDAADHVLVLTRPDEVADLGETFLTGRFVKPVVERRLLAVLCTDIVESTRRAAVMGDAAWRAVIGEFDAASRRIVDGAGGSVVKFTGDGHLVTFDQPGDALRASQELIRVTEALDVPIRCGVHFGELEILDGDVLGVAVVIATRVMGLGGAGATMATSTIVDLVEGAGQQWESMGSHDLKGISRPREIWRLCKAA